MNEFDPAFLRGITQDRRSFLRAAGLVGAGAARAACGVKGAKVSPAKADDVAKFWAGKKQNGHIDFANWASYMDANRTPLKKFTSETGITVNYKEVITDDPTWYGKIQPQLAAGQPIGYDLMVVTDGIELNKLVQFGYLAPLDHKMLTNFEANAGAAFKNESFDKGNVFSVPYATGYTGIGYNPKYVKEPITSIKQLFDPKYKGKIGMMKDTQELGNFGMLLNGINPETSTEADWKKAAATLQAQKPIVRQYVDQNYTKSLSNGDLWISMAWSGDIFQENLSNGSNLQFVVPSEGGTIWTDNMMIPKTAVNPVDALKLIDFFYRIDIAAMLTEEINYVPSVPAVKTQLLKDAQTASKSDAATFTSMASSPLVFPTDTELANLRHYVNLPNPAAEKIYQDLFLPISSG
jgi:spermidine/putrescine transport system substrate-binding protein